MADILNIGTSALLSLQRAIATTGNNIANVNTDGYSRQRVDFNTLPPTTTGAGSTGSGVTTGAIERSYDQFLANEVRERSSSFAEFDTMRELTSRLDDLLADPAVGLAPAIEQFFAAVQDVANNPGSLPERQVLLGEAELLAERFHYLDENLTAINAQVNDRIGGAVSEVNSLAIRIAELNEQIASTRVHSAAESANELLDARDQLINRLAEQVGVTTVEQSDGSVNVLVGNGQPLVVGFRAEQLTTFNDPFDASRTLVGISGPIGGQSDISRFLSGGKLGAAVDFRGEVLNGARNQLGFIATGITETMNLQHRQGLDLNGELGGNLFTPLNPAVFGSATNAGSGTVTATIVSPAALNADTYRLNYDGSAWTLTNQRTRDAQTGPGPFTVNGVEVSVGGSPAAGDAFLLQPTSQGASRFELALHDPAGFAAAAPLRSLATLGNVGSAQMQNLTITSANTLPLGAPVTLTFNPNALGAGVPGYDVSGYPGGPLAYDPATQASGLAVSLGDLTFNLSGEPEAGDTLIVQDNIGGSGDNRNALSLAGLQTAGVLHNGSASYQDAYGTLIADVAVQSRHARSSAATEGVLLEQATAARDNVSGVNLDEEAANLLRFQQAYQAAAQVIAVADEMFQTLLGATRR